MPEVTSFEPGEFCWIELHTTDAEGGKQFYTSLFGWTNVDMPIPGDGVYVMLKKNGRDVGALYENKTAHPAWLLYVAVANADEAAEKAKSLGATVLQPPFDVMEIGRMAVVQDPTGATLALWQSRGHSGFGVNNEPNTFCWGELATKDTEAAERFYTSLLGWKAKRASGAEGMAYTEYHLGDRAVGGMYGITPDMKGMEPSWTPYICVDDADATVASAKAKGANVMVVRDIPNVGRIAFIVDPQGAMFAIIKPNPREG
jgi:predicted enzyme related to lactoylglutathione lyase